MQPRVAPRSPPCSFFYTCILQAAIDFAELRSEAELSAELEAYNVAEWSAAIGEAGWVAVFAGWLALRVVSVWLPVRVCVHTSWPCCRYAGYLLWPYDSFRPCRSLVSASADTPNTIITVPIIPINTIKSPFTPAK
ncbi:MAG: hypothetical protein WA977_00465 [Halobacteriota archaeon]